MSVSLNQILEMPNAAVLAERLNLTLAKEKQKRLRFYETIDADKTMEFINGEVVIHSPSRLMEISASNGLMILLNTFVIKNQLGFVGCGKLLISLSRNDYMPDVCFFSRAKARKFTKEQEYFPAPDIAVEVLSPSTEKYDRETKFQDYAAHGIKEYWIIDAEHEIIEQYFLQNEDYELLLKAKDGTIESIVLPDFKIQIRAVFDEQINLEELKRLI